MRANFSKYSDKDLIQILKEGNVTHKCEAICETSKRKKISSELKDAIYSLIKDNTPFWNQYKVSDFAVAALTLRGDKIDDISTESKWLIESKLSF